MEKISLKTAEEIEKMREGGRIAAAILKCLKKAARPGVTTKTLDLIAEKEIKKACLAGRQAGAAPSFKGYKGYPTATCISVNDEIVHGIPSERVLGEGDIVGIDVGVYYKGFHTDAAMTIGIGKISTEAQKLINVTKKALDSAIKEVRPGKCLGDVQFVIQKTAEEAGFGVIRDLAGHGVGRQLQESPSIPNFGQKGIGLVLKEGMTLAIEPMVSTGDWHVKVQDDGWTVVTADGSLAAHFEHTIAVTKSGCKILTR